MKELMSHNIEETQRFAEQLANNVHGGSLILLMGPLGSGKTAFAQAFGKALGIKRAIKSPTYTIVKEYELPDVGKAQRFIHIDAYRLEEGGAETIDIDQYLDQNHICMIEWPQFVQDYLPDNYIEIHFDFLSEKQRKLTVVLAENADMNHQKLIRNWLE
ncbi:tRNA (adenosine(37)-N6)-threonylcarbamoyltransferase complex ATPase subunit type 1 TsaE [Facklamia sp. DSM 111018]|uniref:tRNA threonylcarbamoyladenosine biosynthesis protein TsaE n=1 Tax=Facklamia lactis TaxID=2749967 RepID=A0ABS0LR19_9LACT|nr:tRNA (adenosine(37)-N6)-threonylcarbamoyltransferase complex ATPase subunit type 1 TsaE [Facklamia lactis]MBG9986402.1 tRNA (adenosine(37)-N6)-threonylcarbamoyltransferase complex ATPase subunit type 1 TsaE [Facklamia lactis]